MLVLVMPISQDSTLAKIGFSRESQQSNLSYVYKFSDTINGFVSSKDNEQSTEEVIENLLKVQEEQPVKSKEQPPES